MINTNPPMRAVSKNWMEWELLIPWVSPNGIPIPAGFVTNFASVPRILWPILPPRGKYAPATIEHDYLCKKKLITQKGADRLFLQAMRKLKVPVWKRYTMYYGVRIYAVVKIIKGMLLLWKR